MEFFFYSPLESLLCADGVPPFSIGKNLVSVSSDEDSYFRILSSPRLSTPSGTLFCSSFDRDLLRLPFCDGELIIPRFSPVPTTKCEDLFVAEERIFGQEYVVNAHIDGFLKITVTGFNEQATVAAPVIPNNMTLKKKDDLLIVILSGEGTFVAVFSTAPLKCVFLSTCAECFFGETLVLSYRSRGVFDYIRRETYSLDGGVKSVGTELVFDRKKLPFLRPEMLALSFFEILSSGGDVTDHLHPSIKERADEIRSFVGDVRYVIPRFSQKKPEFFIVGNSVKRAECAFSDNLISEIELF